MTRVVIAPDKFKGSLPASTVASALARGLVSARPDIEAVCVPVADGGEGTVDAALSAGCERVPVSATGPTGEPVRTGYARRGLEAVVELASVSGLGLVSGFDPLHATSYGTGEVVRAALDAGCRRIVLGIGGSACTDGGAGLVQALGARLLDAHGNDLPRGGAALARLDSLDVSGLHPGLASAELLVAADVDNPLYGENGAAVVYGPQKGASADQVALLDEALRRWGSAVARATGADHSLAPGAGAAGGVGFGAIALLGASLRPGIDLVLDLVDLSSKLAGASLVITGEGSLDRQSLRGKAPAGVARTAHLAGVPVVAVAGQSLLSATELGFTAVYALTDLEPDVRRSMAEAGRLLERVGRTVAREHLTGNAAYRLNERGIMTELDLVLRARRLITPAGERSGCVLVEDGVIVGIDSYDAEPAAAGVVTLANDEVLLPGLVDTHVHVNDPGRSDWEDFSTATRAAAAGGVTTIVDMPLNSIPPTTDVAALAVKRKTAAGQALVDVGFWGGAVPGNLGELRGLHEAGVFGFKCFLLHSGVEEFPQLSASELRDALRETGSLDALMIVHAEDPVTVAPAPHGRLYRDFLASRPRGAENLAIAAVIDLARSTGCRVHVLHLSSSDALPMIRAARRDGVRMTVETCPHYLTFDAESIADGATQFKCCPPIREAENRKLLWQGLAEGTIDCVVSDHSPSTASLKALDTGDFGTAWGGIASLELGLPVVWTEARARGYALTDVVRWMASAPARIAGLSGKGSIAVGSAADFCVFAPDDGFVVDAQRLHHKNPITPYDGRTLTGVVRRTWLRGVLVDDEPRGRLLSRGAA